MKLHLKAT